MRSFALLRTNVGLSTNIKVMVDSNYNLALDSIESVSDLSLDKYKKVKFTKKNYWDELIRYFFDNTPSEIAYGIKDDTDVEIMKNDFSFQYDEIYQYGARNISNNKSYIEEFEYFAPLWISKGKLPKYFIIFRVDGPGVISLNSTNFFNEIINKMKVVKIFDLTRKTALGEWLDLNFSKKNQFFPESPLEMDFRILEFCKWNGINYESGGYVSKSLFIDDVLDEEKEIFELEKFIYDNYKSNKVVMANILNLSFLFDDEPSTPEVKRKWSINRYYGFYLEEIELVRTLSPYITPFLLPDTIILKDNILYSPSNEDPFVEGWSDSRPFYVEYKGNYYKVEKIQQRGGTNLVNNPVTTNTGPRGPMNLTGPMPLLAVEEYVNTYSTKYKIISDVRLKDKQSEINKNFGYINSSSILEDYFNNPLVISNFDDAHVWLIEVDGIYHKIAKNRNSQLRIVSDYSFNYGPNKYEYTVAGKKTVVSTIVDFENPPKKWSIYKLKFSDIKDFDDRIIDTEFSKFEYEKKESLTNTDETKLYFTNLNSNTNPPSLDDFIYQGKVVNVPVSSEYTAGQETFKVENDTLTTLWKKNPVHCRWSYKNSLSAADYPYLLNNSQIMEDYNRTTNPFDYDPKRIERNLDYFYTINVPTASYTHHSLHVVGYTNSFSIDNNFKFEVDKYLGAATYAVGTNSYAFYNYDYFSHFFERKVYFDNGKISKNAKKFSLFNVGEKSIPNISVFRGIKFFLYDVDTIKKSANGELNITLKNSNTFEDYKFSILLSENDFSVDNNSRVVNSTNQMNWQIIDEWKMDTTYNPGDIGIFDDILYISMIQNVVNYPTVTVNSRDVKSAPNHYSIEWQFLNMTYSIFWNPSKTTYNESSSSFYDYVVYNSGEYYQYENSGTENFWNPATAATTGYGVGDVILYKNQYYMSMTSSNSFAPDYVLEHRVIDKWTKYWVATQSTNPKWKPIELWNPTTRYRVSLGSYKLVIHNDIVWRTTSGSTGVEPGLNNNTWQRLYSLLPDTNIVYQPNNNPIIQMHNQYYLINSNITNATLDNGITIYINKKWKNILININIADGTTPYTTGWERDNLYSDLNKKLTANNFILAINDIKNKYGFTDYVNYVVINENGRIEKFNYELNITSLPYMMMCETPEELDVKVESLIVRPVQVTGDLIPKRVLSNGNIKDINYLNYYNNTAIASTIQENRFAPRVIENYHGNQNITKNTIYRFSGTYMPLFYDIELFQKNYEKESTGNYKFDTNLSYFGIMRERRISKINRNGSILRLKDSKQNRSIYPMLDEFGYTIDDFFIFSSTWDLQYHVETNLNEVVEATPNLNVLTTAETDLDQIGSAIPSGDDLQALPSQVLYQIGQPNVTINAPSDIETNQNIS